MHDPICILLTVGGLVAFVLLIVHATRTNRGAGAEGGALHAYVTQLYRQMVAYHERLGGLASDVQDLRRRLAALEHTTDRLARAAGLEAEAPPAAETPPPPPREPERQPRPQPVARPAPVWGPAAPVISLAPATPSPAPVAATPLVAAAPRRSLEEIIGEKWLLWVGVCLVVLAGAFGLAYGWSRIPETMRVLLGAIAGAAFLGGAEALRERTSRSVCAGMSSCGIVLLYLSAWAATAHYGLITLEAGLVCMAAITALCVGLALNGDAVELLGLGIAGGYLTPALLAGPGPSSLSPHSLFAYLAVLDAGVLAASFARRWRAIHHIALALTGVWVAVWVGQHAPLDAATAWTVFAYVSLFFGLFVLVASAYPLRLRRPVEVADILFLVALATVYLAGGAAIVPTEPTWARGVFALALAGFWGLLLVVAVRRAPEDIPLRVSCTALAIATLTTAWPLLLEGSALAAAWAGQAAALAVLAASTRRATILSGALLVEALSIAALLWSELPVFVRYEAWLANPRTATLAIQTASCIALALVAGRWGRAEGGRRDVLAASGAGAVCASGLTLGWALLAVWEGQERFGWFEALPLRETTLALAGLAAVHSLLSVVVGFAVRTPALRAWGLATGTATVLTACAVSLATRSAAWPPFANTQMAVFATIAICALGLAWASRRWEEQLTASEEGTFLPPLWSLVCALALLWGTTPEVWRSAFEAYPAAMPDLEGAAGCMVLLLWIAAGMASFGVGVAVSHAPLRWLGSLLVHLSAAAGVCVAAATAGAEWNAWANPRAAVLLAAIVAELALAWLSIRLRARLSEEERAALRPEHLAMVAGLLVLWVATQEVHRAVLSVATTPYTPQLAVSLVWTLYAAVAMGLGIALRRMRARYLALVVFGLAVAKTFLVDLSFLTGGYRVLSFGVLGVVLIAAAALYGRYREALFGKGEGVEA